jgi:hypothetical protein
MTHVWQRDRAVSHDEIVAALEQIAHLGHGGAELSVADLERMIANTSGAGRAILTSDPAGEEDPPAEPAVP